MSFSEFKKDAKGKLEDYRPEIDAEALWADLAPQMPKKKKRRPFVWFFLGGLLLGASAIYWWPLKETKTAKPSSGQRSPIAQESTASLESSTKKLENPKPSTTIPTKKQLTKSNPQQQQNIPAASPTNSNNQSTTFSAKKKAVATSPQQSIKNIDSKTHPNFISTNSRHLLPERAQVPDFPKTTESNDLPITQETQTRWSAFNKIQSEDIDFLEYSPEAYFAKAIKRASAPSMQYCVSTAGKPWQWTLGLRAGGARLTEHSSSQQSGLEEYIDKRFTTEAPLEDLNAAFEIQIRHHNGFYFQTGLEYSRMTSRFLQETQTTETRINPDGVQKILTNSATGDTTFIYGPTPQQRTTIFTKIRYNNFHALQIPLIAGYRLEQHKWFFGIEAGVLINAHLKKSGTIAGLGDDELYDLEKDELNWYKNRLGLRPVAAIQAGYRILPNWEVFASPQYRPQVKVTTSNNPLQQSYSSLNLSAGIRVNL